MDTMQIKFTTPRYEDRITFEPLTGNRVRVTESSTNKYDGSLSYRLEREVPEYQARQNYRNRIMAGWKTDHGYS